MHLVISKEDLTRALGAVSKVVKSRTTIPILSCVMLTAAGRGLSVIATDLDILASTGAVAEVKANGSLCVDAKLLTDIARKAAGDITMIVEGDRLLVKSGRSRFQLPILPTTDFPDFGTAKYDATFDIDLAALFAPVAFAISTEETRFYLGGVFFKGEGGKFTAVATDGHRLGRHVADGYEAFNGIIVPRKTVGLIPKGVVTVSVSDTRIRIEHKDITLTSKLIDGTFPDYERVIPKSNDKVVTVDRDAIMKAADRVSTVSTVSSERGRAVKLTIAPGSIALVVNNPDSGSAEDEVAAEYSGEPIDIGFNAQYVRDVFGVLPAGSVQLALADSGSPALVTGGAEGLTLVIMPMRVS